MRLLGLKTFRHGIHPGEAKDATKGLAIQQFPFAPRLVVPLAQHIGNPSVPTVRPGEEVCRGQRIARPEGHLSVAMHAPATGVVRDIALTPTILGRMSLAIHIEPHAASTQEATPGTPCSLDAGPEEILRAVQEAGVVGLGGAAFPTHAKLTVPDGKRVDTLVVNGAECEPYLTTDHRVMLEQSDDLFVGIRYLLRATGAERVVIGVESNKEDAATLLRDRLPADLPVSVEVLRVKYPQGAEKMLITALLGREIPSGRLPIDIGAMCINVATTAEIGRLLPLGSGVRLWGITIGGPAVRRKGNYRIPIGTPLRFVLDTVGVDTSVARVFLGGPMMGNAVSSLDIVVTKGTSGVTAFTDIEAEWAHRRVFPCIGCGYCVDACPVFLNPAELERLAGSGGYAAMRSNHALMDCIECGSCSFVCPSHIPLVQHFRVAKAAVRKADAA